MLPTGPVALSEIADRLAILEVACHRCDRHGRLQTEHLVAQHGAGTSIPKRLSVLSADCPRRQSIEHGQTTDACGVHVPQLSRLF
jgi:hypothetical protein